MNYEREIETLLEKLKSLVMKRLQNSGKETGRLVKMLHECCKYVEDEGYWNLELIGDHQDHLEIGGDQQQYKGVKILQEFLLVYSIALRQRLVEGSVWAES